MSAYLCLSMYPFLSVFPFFRSDVSLSFFHFHISANSGTASWREMRSAAWARITELSIMSSCREKITACSFRSSMTVHLHLCPVRHEMHTLFYPLSFTSFSLFPLCCFVLIVINYARNIALKTNSSSRS